MGDKKRLMRGCRGLSRVDIVGHYMGHIPRHLPAPFLRHFLHRAPLVPPLLPLLDLPCRVELSFLRNPHVALLRRSLPPDGPIPVSR